MTKEEELKYKKQDAFEEIKLHRFKNSDDFVKLMEGFIKRYKEDVKENKSEFPIKNWEDEKFKMWQIIREAYEEGHNQADDYWVETMWELTDAEDHFRDKVRDEI